jgi:hypothetical protein
MQVDDEVKELHGIFQKLVELHKHLAQFQGQPPVDYTQMVVNVYKHWITQKNFVKKDDQAFQQMDSIVKKMYIDFFMAGVLMT